MDIFILKIEGLGGHAAMPHQTKDPVVAAGMVIASRLSVDRGALSPAVVDQLESFNRAVGLPVAVPPEISTADLLNAMGSDKKVAAGKVRYILLSALGEAIVTERVTEDDIARVITA